MAGQVFIMGTQILVFDRFGKPIDDIDCEVRRSWELNGIGKAIFTMAKTDLKCTEVNLRFGNIVLIENDECGRWAGTIDLPRRWRNDTIIFTAYTPEWLLKYNVWAGNGYTDETAGERFETDYFFDTTTSLTALFETGEVYKAGVTWSEDVAQRWYNCYEKLQEMADITGQEWEFVPRLKASGDIYFEANWLEQRGSTYSDIVIEEGKHVRLSGGEIFIEQGEIINYPYAYWPSGQYYGNDNDYDTASSVLYGERFKTWGIQYTNDDAVDAWLAGKLATYKEPQRTFNISIVNDGNIFEYMDIGNTVGLRLVNYGFTDNAFGIDTTIRILAKEYAENDGFMTLTVTEV